MKNYLIEMRKLRETLPKFYAEFIIKHRYQHLSKEEAIAKRKEFNKMMNGSGHYLWAKDKYMKDCVIELSEKYSYFLKIYV